MFRLSSGLDKWFPLTAATKHDEVQGEVLVEIMLTEQGASDDHMKALVTVVEARYLIYQFGFFTCM